MCAAAEFKAAKKILESLKSGKGLFWVKTFHNKAWKDKHFTNYATLFLLMFIYAAFSGQNFVKVTFQLSTEDSVAEDSGADE